MKKKIFGGIAVLAIIAVAALNINFNLQKSNLSGISLANVEALAEEYNDPNKPKDTPFNLYTGECHKLNTMSCPK